ncbi:MAG: glycerol-3-phosphate 1-O-acyltransferase PlsY [Pseudomonadota bacterium]
MNPQWLGLISLWFGLGYLCGSVPFGILVARVFGLGNLRDIGSGNIGATNVLRTGSKPAAAATLLLDALKGTLPVVAAIQLADTDMAIAAGFGAFIGHILPIWLKFRGGKGVATYVGILLGFGWPFLVVFAVIWLTLAATLRYSSLAALVASVAVPAYGFYIGNVKLGLALLAMTIIVYLTHRENIARLIKGEETRIGSKPKPS